LLLLPLCVRMTYIVAMTVVAVKRTLLTKSRIRRIDQAVQRGVTIRKESYHSNAAKAVAACALLHTWPLQYRSAETKTAWAMKPANQKSIVTVSTARIA
jgi:hypothetical protein